ncbi:hypothetical protein AYO40_04420 [Planctomycetaceae bacterium SCGC AG-212-D15]|nr:hypothetical protein AYO40_04420 [Planctomycetaceae bacterium SCGC AG-212-D15]
MIQTRPPPASQPVTTRDYLSFSALALYTACPLRYFFKYVTGLPESIVSASLVFGSAIHASLQFHFEELLAGNQPPSRDSLLDAFWDAWNRQDPKSIRFGRDGGLNEMGALADRMLSAFQTSVLARPTGRVIAVEEELRGELIPGLPDLLARVDLIVETDASLVVTDFKTARSEWSQEHVADASGQLLLYHELAKSLSGGKALRLEFAVLTKTRFPKVAILPVMGDPMRIERTKKIVERVWKAIEGAHFYPSPSAMNCPTCPYRKECRAWEG